MPGEGPAFAFPWNTKQPPMPDIEPIFTVPDPHPTAYVTWVRPSSSTTNTSVRNGHAVSMIVFDDSSVVNQQKYYSSLEGTRTHNRLDYVGPQEKEQFLAYLFERLRDR